MSALAAVPRETRAPRPLTVLDDVLLELIDVGPNVRVDPGELEELAASIRALGVLEPIKVTKQPDGRYQAVFGQRRVLAARLAGQLRIPAIIEPASAIDQAGARRSIEQLVENLQRADLNPIDEAVALRDVLDADAKLTQDALADQIGRSRPWVTNTLGLLEAAPAVQDAVRTGSLTAAHAKAIKGLNVDDQAELAQKAISGNWSAHDTERQAKWAKDNEKTRAASRAAAERHAKAAIAMLEKVANRKTVTVAVADYAGNGVKPLLEADGWKVVDGYNVQIPSPACGCKDVWRLEIPYGKADVELAPACNSTEHRVARDAERDAGWKRQNEQRERQREAQELARDTQTVGLADWLVANPRDLFARRLLIYAATLEEDENLIERYLPGEDEEAIDARDDAAWDAICAIPEDKLTTVLARATAENVMNHWQMSKTMLAAITERVPVASPAKPSKSRKRQGDAASTEELLAAGVDVDVNETAER